MDGFFFLVMGHAHLVPDGLSWTQEQSLPVVRDMDIGYHFMLNMMLPTMIDHRQHEHPASPPVPTSTQPAHENVNVIKENRAFEISVHVFHPMLRRIRIRVTPLFGLCGASVEKQYW